LVNEFVNLRIHDGNPNAETSYLNHINSLRMNQFKELKKVKLPLFQTEDGTPIFEGDVVVSVKLDRGYHILSHKASKELAYENKTIKWFCTIDAAENWVLLNKPVLSVNDIFNNIIFDWEERKKCVLAHAKAFYENDHKNNNPLYKKILELAKSKIAPKEAIK
jgi:hypothetical protein